MGKESPCELQDHFELKVFDRFRILVIGMLVVAMGCSVAATRPVQEMSNAEAAIRAAKDLNADSLASELFRKANDYNFKAKREYRLKNFELARKLALRATRYAEEAEFRALRGGGALPDAGGAIDEEGAIPDAEASFEEIPGEPSVPFEEEPRPSEEPKTKKDDGTDYNAYVRKEAEREQLEREKAANEKALPDKSPPAKDSTYSRGPADPRPFSEIELAQNSQIRTGTLSRAVGPGVKLSTPKPAPITKSDKPKIVYMPVPEQSKNEDDNYGADIPDADELDRDMPTREEAEEREIKAKQARTKDKGESS